jgi:hypothetical protein
LLEPIPNLPLNQPTNHQSINQSTSFQQQNGHDKRGMKWPISVAPFHAVILAGGGRKPFVPQIQELTQQVYTQLANVLVNNSSSPAERPREVMLDDRWRMKFKARVAEAELVCHIVCLPVVVFSLLSMCLSAWHVSE